MRRSIPLLLLAATGLLLPAASDALLPWKPVRVTPNGPVPRVVEATAGVTPIAWYNAEGATARYAVFEDGSCKTRVTPSENTLIGCIPKHAGRYTYRLIGMPSRYGHGVVVVRRAGRSVTLQASRRVVIFGEAVELHGAVYMNVASGGPPTEYRDEVTVIARAANSGAYRAGRVRSGEFASRDFGPRDGWRLTVRPRVATTYRARLVDEPDTFLPASSAAVRIEVRPRVTLVVTDGRLEVRVSIAGSAERKSVWLQRRVRGQWLPDRRATLDETSIALLRLPARGAVVRAVMYAAQAGPGYRTGFSAPLRISG